MSFLSSAVAKRRLVLFCARLLLQRVMASSIPQTGMDEFEPKCLRVPGCTGSQSIACNEPELSRHGSLPNSIISQGVSKCQNRIACWRCASH